MLPIITQILLRVFKRQIYLIFVMIVLVLHILDYIDRYCNQKVTFFYQNWQFRISCIRYTKIDTDSFNTNSKPESTIFNI